MANLESREHICAVHLTVVFLLVPLIVNRLTCSSPAKAMVAMSAALPAVRHTISFRPHCVASNLTSTAVMSFALLRHLRHVVTYGRNGRTLIGHILTASSKLTIYCIYLILLMRVLSRAVSNLG